MSLVDLALVHHNMLQAGREAEVRRLWPGLWGLPWGLWWAI